MLGGGDNNTTFLFILCVDTLSHFFCYFGVMTVTETNVFFLNRVDDSTQLIYFYFCDIFVKSGSFHCQRK